MSDYFFYQKVRDHIGHEIEAVGYFGDMPDPVNVAIECITCGTVIVDCDLPAVNPEKIGD